jgi:predicted acylesterase/phospholipase RssA
MFAAYQAGAWSVLADCFEPDLIVGASAGAVNAWAIAGGCPPKQLIRDWLALDCAATYRWQMPRAIHGGLLNCRPLMARIDEIYASFRPKVECAVVITELARLRPRIIRGSEITADVLKASTAIFGIFEQVRIEGKVYTDGGILGALPVWAAAELGAERVVAINALPGGLLPKAVMAVVRSLSRFRPVVPPELEVIEIAPPALLGSAKASLYWSRENTGRWIEQGRRDALAQRHSIENCFERK